MFHSFTLPLEIPDKSKLHPGNCAKLYYIALGNSNTKNQDSWNFHIILLGHPRKFHMLHPISLIPLEIPYLQPPLFGFFLEQPNIKRGFIFFHLILVGISSILILSVEIRGVGGFLLNRQNLLSVTKVIYQQCLCKTCYLHTGEYFRWLAT